jgi:L,D-transpeptidase catalytic domain
LIRISSLLLISALALSSAGMAHAASGQPASVASIPAAHLAATANILAVTADRTPPTTPVITSPTNPRSGCWYNTRIERFSWDSSDGESGIAGYSYRVDRRADGKPGALLPRTSLTLRNLADGKWVLHVWAQDRAGNWSSQAIFKLNLDTTPPRIRFPSSNNHIFNPYVTSQTWRYSVDQWAHVTVDIRRSSQPKPVLVKDLGTLRPGEHTYVWDGKTESGRLSAADWYWFHVTATDGVGNSSNLAFGGIHVQPVRPLPKQIVISLSQQSISAYENGRLVWSGLATTGNRTLTPTPSGHYAIFAKYSPFQFVSPWPPGHPYWYASAWSSYAMEFISGGYFIHDAPWRSVFGPASQGGDTPGTDYGGTHGCVNVPPATAEFLWNWAPIGTPVDVVW